MIWKFGLTKFFFKEIIRFIHYGGIKLIKSDRKDGLFNRTVFSIDDNKYLLNIKSWYIGTDVGFCGTKDWSNVCWKSDLPSQE